MGNASMSVALLLIGPAPFIALTANRNLLYVCGALIGLGYSLVRKTIGTDII
jgi:hypothetical protein